MLGSLAAGYRDYLKVCTCHCWLHCSHKQLLVLSWSSCLVRGWDLTWEKYISSIWVPTGCSPLDMQQMPFQYLGPHRLLTSSQGTIAFPDLGSHRLTS